MNFSDAEKKLLLRLAESSGLISIPESDVGTAYRLDDDGLVFTCLDKAEWTLYATITFEGRKAVSKMDAAVES